MNIYFVRVRVCAVCAAHGRARQEQSGQSELLAAALRDVTARGTADAEAGRTGGNEPGEWLAGRFARTTQGWTLRRTPRREVFFPTVASREYMA